MADVPALIVSHLTVQFERQEHPAVEDVSFSLEEGQIAILIGPNGSGKSTVLKAILGLVPFTGEVSIFGVPALGARRQIGYVPQRLGFDVTLPLTVREAVRMPLLGGRGPEVGGRRSTTSRKRWESPSCSTGPWARSRAASSSAP